jgi:hypothetical protein
MIDGMHFSYVIDVKAQRGANIDLDYVESQAEHNTT